MHNFQASSRRENSTAVLGPTHSVLPACAGVTPILQGQYSTPERQLAAFRGHSEEAVSRYTEDLVVVKATNTYICSPCALEATGAGEQGVPVPQAAEAAQGWSRVRCTRPAWRGAALTLVASAHAHRAGAGGYGGTPPEGTRAAPVHVAVAPPCLERPGVAPRRRGRGEQRQARRG